jgi:hypothetical protein
MKQYTTPPGKKDKEEKQADAEVQQKEIDESNEAAQQKENDNPGNQKKDDTNNVPEVDTKITNNDEEQAVYE